MNTRSLLLALLVLPCLSMAAAPHNPEERAAALRALQWKEGPSVAAIADKATLKTTDSLVYLDEANSKKFLELTDNIPSDGSYIVYNIKDNWWADFSFNPAGYIKDDEKIDADALLKSLKEGDEAGNEERKRLGIADLHTEGWFVPPHYDTATKRLEWGVKLRSGNDYNVNYTVRILGRTGFTSATLVSSPEKLATDVESFKAILPGFEYKSGEKYAEFKEGDRIAEYGLAALVAGGAAAIATKKGLWSVIGAFLAASWKIVAGIGVAAIAGLKNLFKRKQS